MILQVVHQVKEVKVVIVVVIVVVVQKVKVKVVVNQKKNVIHQIIIQLYLLNQKH